jgi:hypothetical protein
VGRMGENERARTFDVSPKQLEGSSVQAILSFSS